MTSTANRVPAGVPTGGQFAPSQHSGSDVELDGGDDCCADRVEYVGSNPHIFEAIESLTAGRVRENFLDGRDDDPLDEISDRELNSVIGKHQGDITKALDAVRECGEDDAWAEHDNLCRRAAETAIETKNRELRPAG